MRLAAPADDAGYAQVLYRALREADALGLRRVIAVPPGGPGPLATAVADRLRRAAGGSAAGAGASPAGGAVAGQA